jgi:hypothetical protein
MPLQPFGSMWRLFAEVLDVDPPVQDAFVAEAQVER